MGSYTFRWEHPAEEVYVTGSFDNWAKTIKLDKKDVVHEKTVPLSVTSVPILYKFVADGEWKHDHTAQTQKDGSGNLNNVLYPEDIAPPTNSMVSSTISSVAPEASTTEMAGKVPLEKNPESSPPPGAFPETPAADTDDEKKDGLGGAVAGAAAGLSAVAAAGAAAVGLSSAGDKKEEKDQTMSVNPIPASAGSGNPIHLAPGEKVPDPATINNNTLTSNVRDDPSLASSAQDANQTFGVAPLPATGGIGNPVQLPPGEKVPDPSTITSNTIDSNVKLDKQSYEKSDSGAPQLPPVLTPQSEREAGGAAIFGGLGPQTTNMIPESSMGMGSDAPAPMEGAAMSSVGVNSTTNQLAGQVPKEPRGVPEVVAESQQEAHAAPEASANPTAVAEKSDMEKELKSKVPEEEAGSDSKNTSNAGGITGAIAGGVAAAGAAAAGAAAVVREKTTETTGKDPVSVLPESAQKQVDSTLGNPGPQGTADGVPDEVTTSQNEAHASPEAAANPEAVHEKNDVEKELLKKVPQSEASGEPAPTVSAATAATAPVAATSASGAGLSDPAAIAARATGPQTTGASQSGAPQLADPVGGGLAPINMEDKPTDGSKELNAPADAPAQTQATKVTEEAKAQDSRDVSPMSKPNTAGQTNPTVTSGVASGETAAKQTSTPVGTPRKNGAGASSTGNKRNSIIDRLKGTPDSQKTTGSEGKKKGFFSKLKEKLKQ